MKMPVTDQLKIIDNKIKANQVQYDLDRSAAKISAYSSADLRKYEYLTSDGWDTNRVYLNNPNLIILHWIQGLKGEDKKEELLKKY